MCPNKALLIPLNVLVASSPPFDYLSSQHELSRCGQGEIGVWVQMMVKHFIKQQIRQQAKNRTENRVGHHRRQHGAGVLESREQND